MSQAKVIGSDLRVEEIVAQADALIASIEAAKIPGRSHVRVIVLDENQRQEVEQITRLLDAVNKALLVYYEGSALSSGIQESLPPSIPNEPSLNTPEL